MLTGLLISFHLVFILLSINFISKITGLTKEVLKSITMLELYHPFLLHPSSHPGNKNEREKELTDGVLEERLCPTWQRSHHGFVFLFPFLFVGSCWEGNYKPELETKWLTNQPTTPMKGFWRTDLRIGLWCRDFIGILLIILSGLQFTDWQESIPRKDPTGRSAQWFYSWSNRWQTITVNPKTLNRFWSGYIRFVIGFIGVIVVGYIQDGNDIQEIGYNAWAIPTYQPGLTSGYKRFPLPPCNPGVDGASLGIELMAGGGQGDIGGGLFRVLWWFISFPFLFHQ